MLTASSSMTIPRINGRMEDDPRSNEADDTDDKQDDAQYEIGLESGLGFFAVKVGKKPYPSVQERRNADKDAEKPCQFRWFH